LNSTLQVLRESANRFDIMKIALISLPAAVEPTPHLLVASVQDASPSSEAIKQAVQSQVTVPGAEVYRGDHLRVA
jgi:hypothetical protein